MEGFVMDDFVLSGLTFLALLVFLAYFGRIGCNESPPPDSPSSNPHSLSDSPYEVVPSQARLYHQYCQPSSPNPANSHYPPTSQRSAYPTPSQHSRYQPYRKPSIRHFEQTIPSVSQDVSATIAVKYTSELPHLAITQAPDVSVAPLVSDIPEDYESLRLKARREGDRMAERFHQSKEAFASNQKRLAKELSTMGRAHKENMVRLNKEASAKIFEENNQRCNANTVDLHGLYVTEAEFYFKRTLEQVRDRGESSLRVIVGKGNHSDGNNPRIKPAIQVLGKSLGMTVNVDPVNDGCLLVNC